MTSSGVKARMRPLAPLLLSACLIFLAMAAAPAAAPARATPPRSVKASPSVAGRLGYPPGFTIEASNGYSLFVFGAPARRSHPAAIVIVATGKSDEVLYSAPATVTETSIQASLGALGEVAVTFHPSGKARAVRSDCGGKPVSFDSGYYEGTIDFHGEEGFTGIEATRAQGDVRFLINIVCPGISGGRGGLFTPGAELDAVTERSRSGPYLMVIKNRPTARAHYEVGLSEVRDGVSISRFATLVAPASTFTYDARVRTATLHPPAPFSGSARFHRRATPRNRWTGNLTVDLPGRKGVMLTGGGIRAKLAHAHWDLNGSPQ